MAIGNVEFVGDRANGTVSILMPGKTITLTCTDKPWPPAQKPEPKPMSETSQFGRAVGGLFRAIDNAARRISGLPIAEEMADPFGENGTDEGTDIQPESGEALQEDAAESGDEAGEAVEEDSDALEPAQPE
jgi:hypothetical protein